MKTREMLLVTIFSNVCQIYRSRSESETMSSNSSGYIEFENIRVCFPSPS